MPKTYSINGVQLKPNYLKLVYNPKLKQRARALRQSRNLPEVLFWMRVNKGQFHRLDFDRQKIIGNYIVDFIVNRLGWSSKSMALHITAESKKMRREKSGLMTKAVELFDLQLC